VTKIYCIGEAKLDILFKDSEAVTSKAGGSSYNTSITLGRLSQPVCFIGESGSDHVGSLVLEHLRNNGVNTKYLIRSDNIQTSLALAFFDDNNNAEYDFYKSERKEELTLKSPEFFEDDIVLFGSSFSINSKTHNSIIKIVKKAKNAGATVIYDPNFRRSHLRNLDKTLPAIKENMKYSSIIKGSNEDFNFIFGLSSPLEVFNTIKSFSDAALIYTRSTESTFLIAKDKVSEFPVKKITPVSTIGAGDNFTAGVIYSLICEGYDLDKAVQKGLVFGAKACETMENYLSKETLRDLFF